MARIRNKKISEIRFWREKSILRQIRYNISFFREGKKLRENFLLSHSLSDTPSRDEICARNVFMKTINLKIFTLSDFSLFVTLSHDLASNSQSRKKNCAIFSGENIKNIDFWVLFWKTEKKSKFADFEKFQHFLWNWHFFRFFPFRGTCGFSMFFSHVNSSEFHSESRNWIFAHFPKF